MQSPTKHPRRRAAIVVGAAGLAVVGAVGVGVAAFADGTPTPGTSQLPSGAPSGAPSQHDDRPGGPGGTHSPHIGGEVLTVSGSTVTVKDRDGFTRTITLADDAKVTKDGSSSTASAITKGTWIEATGTVDSNGTTLDATAVSIGRPTPPKGGPGGERPAAPDGTAPTPPSSAS